MGKLREEQQSTMANAAAGRPRLGAGTSLRLRRFLLTIATCSAVVMAGASSASALQVGVDWSGVWAQSKSTSEWNVIKHSGASVYRVMIWDGLWVSEGCTKSQCPAFDPIFRQAAEHGVTVLPYFFDGGYPKEGEAAWEQWYTVVQEAVMRYGRNGVFWQQNPSLAATPVTAWELGNEPNLAVENGNYGGGSKADPTRYAKFLIHMSAGARTAAQSQSGQGTTVLLGGLYMGRVGTESMGWKPFLEQAYGVAGFPEAFDGISIHPYGFDYVHEAPSKKTIGETTSEITAIRTLLGSETWGPSRTLWITELGWPVVSNASGASGVDEATQSRLLTESFNWVKNHQGVVGGNGNNKIESLLWYNLRDDNTQTTWAYRDGLVKDEIARGVRPAWTAFQAQTGAAAWTPPAELAPSVATGGAGEVGTGDATLSGTVNPHELPTTYRFEYGTTTAYGSSVPVSAASAGEGASAVVESVAVAGLEPATTYHYRITAHNEVGTTYGADAVFTTVGGAPAQAFDPAGNLYVATRGPGNTLYVTVRYNDGTWHGPFQEAGPGTTYSAAAEAFDSADNLYIATQGPGNTLYVTVRYNDGIWHGPFQEAGPGTTFSTPSEVFDPGDGSLYIAAEGPSNTLYETVRYVDGTWHGPFQEAGPGTTFSAPAQVIDPGDRSLYIAAQGPSNTLYETVRYNDGTWHGPFQEAAPGTTYSSPTEIFDSARTLFIATQGPANSFYVTNRYVDGSWHGPFQIAAPGTTYSGLSQIFDASGTLWVASEGPSNTLYETVRYGTDFTWHGPFQIDAPGTTY